MNVEKKEVVSPKILFAVERKVIKSYIIKKLRTTVFSFSFQFKRIIG